MLRKIVSIRNVGRFPNYNALGNVPLNRYNLIFGENGRSKTTPCASPLTTVSAGPPSATTIDVFFSPKGAATEAIIQELRRAKSEILVYACNFTSVPIAKALVDAHKGWGKASAVLNKSQRPEKFSSATYKGDIGIESKHLRGA